MAYSDAQQMVSRATAFQKSERFPQAVRLLENGIRQCKEGPEDQRSSLLLHFTLGYLYQQQAAVNLEEKKVLLERSVTYYSMVLSQRPGHAATTRNLTQVFQSLGDMAQARHVLERAIEVNTNEGATFAVMLGDVLLDEKNYESAMGAYYGAMEIDPDKMTPRRKIVAMYRYMPIPWVGKQLKELKSWEARFSSLARSGYEEVMARCHGDKPILAEHALVRWVSLLARREWLRSDSVESIPGAWESQAVNDLKNYLNEPERELERGDWWRAEKQRAHIVGQMAMALGNQRIRRKEIHQAEMIWKAGIRVSPPPMGEHEDEPIEGRMIKLDLQTALALLYVNHKSNLDRNSRKINRLTQELFETKGVSYSLNDMEAIQRHHTTLGLIYVELKEWGGRHKVGSAIFQLENAIIWSQKRGDTRPQPRIYALLGKSYEAVDEKENAQQSFLKAGELYMATDQLGHSGKNLEKAASVMKVSSIDKPRLMQLQGILSTRQRVTHAAKESSNLLQLDAYIRHDPVCAWVFEDTVDTLDPRFMNQQRFKVIADVARQARNAGNFIIASKYSTRAFGLAVRKVDSMTGTADLIRLETVKGVMAEMTGTDTGQMNIKQIKPEGDFTGKSWKLTLPSQTETNFVSVKDNEALLGEISWELKNRGTSWPRNVILKPSKEGHVFTVKGEDENNLNKAIEAIKKRRNVNIRVERK